MTLGQPAGGELHRRLQRILGDEHVVDAGEKPGFSEKTRFLGQRGILHNVLAVHAGRGRADDTQTAPARRMV